MGVFAFSLADSILWAVAVLVALTFFSGLIVRRRAVYTDTLKENVRRRQAAAETSDEASE